MPPLRSPPGRDAPRIRPGCGVRGTSLGPGSGMGSCRLSCQQGQGPPVTFPVAPQLSLTTPPAEHAPSPGHQFNSESQRRAPALACHCPGGCPAVSPPAPRGLSPGSSQEGPGTGVAPREELPRGPGSGGVPGGEGGLSLVDNLGPAWGPRPGVLHPLGVAGRCEGSEPGAGLNSTPSWVKVLLVFGGSLCLSPGSLCLSPGSLCSRCYLKGQ